MSMYHLVMGKPSGLAELAALTAVQGTNQSGSVFQRFRDAWFDFEADEAVVLTRTGSSSLSESEAANEPITMMAGYLRHHDWELDASYALFYFKIPDDLKELYAAVKDSAPEGYKTPIKIFEELLESLPK